jgi:aspartate kinase
MGDATDELLSLAAAITDTPDERELDMLLATGEHQSATLVSMALHAIGVPAISLTGAQAGITTDDSHGRARIANVEPRRVRTELDRGNVVIVAGFQGQRGFAGDAVAAEQNETTTLGRGGSDTTAVALAGALGAESCQIFTDVDGVYTADPRVVPEALKLPVVTYEEMLEMSASGAKVMALRSVEFARNHGVRLHVRSTFNESEGTWIQEEDEQLLEKAIISGVTHDTSEAKLTLIGVPDRPGVAARVFRALADAGVNIDMIVQNVSSEGLTDISFTLPKSDLVVAEPILEAGCKDVGAAGWSQDSEIAKVSLIGAGMRSHPGVAADMFEALAEAGINIEIISTSSIRISCVVRAADVDRAVQVVHEKFRLFAEERAGA